MSNSFGISVDPNHSGDYSSLVHTELLPSPAVIKFDINIISQQPSDVGIFINEEHNFGTGAWKNAYLFGIGYAATSNSVLIRDSTDRNGTSGNWDESLGVHHIEIQMSGSANTPIKIFEDGNLILSWNSKADFNVNEIMLSLFGLGSQFSNFQYCTEVGCDPLPTTVPTTTPVASLTPSPTPTLIASQTPTPTNTPTATPSPTSNPVTKVVIVPGMGGSWNQDAILNCDINAGGTWGPTPYFGDLYSGLTQSFTLNGFTPYIYYYDWRKQITQNTSGLAQFIQSKKTPNEKVDIVGHSMGGLVARAYIENEGNNNSVYKLLTAGSPHKGTILAYPAWSGGEIWSDDLRIRIATTLVKQLCSNKLKLSDKDTIRKVAPSFQNLLPIFNYLKDKKTNIVKTVSSMASQNNWLPTNNFNSPFFGVTVGTLAGTGVNTLTTLVTNPPTKAQTKQGLWQDGNPVQKIYNSQGDGSVLVDSASLPGSTQILVNQDHGGIVSSSQGINAILTFLKGNSQTQSLSNSQTKSETSALVLLSDAGTFSVEDPNGNKRQSDRGMVAFINPKNGSHKLFLQPKSWGTRFIVAQFLANGDIKWKEYNFTNILPKWKSIRFDATHPSDNPLQ